MTDASLFGDAGAPPPADGGAGGSPPAAGGGAPPPAGDNAAAALGWRASLPVEFRDDPAISKFTEPASLAKSYINLSQMLGSEKIPLPKDDNDQEGWDRFHKAAGRPDDPKTYAFDRPQQLPAGVTYDDNMEVWWRQSAHKAGLSNRQARALYNDYIKMYEEGTIVSDRGAKEQTVAARTELQRDWGTSFNLNHQIANSMFKEFDPEVQAMMVSSGLARNPKFVKNLHKIAARSRGETSLKDGEQRPFGGKTAEQLKAEASSHRTRFEKELMDKSHPDHGLRVNEQANFYKQMFPDA
jgi:hypothetical protein